MGLRTKLLNMANLFHVQQDHSVFASDMKFTVNIQVLPGFQVIFDNSRMEACHSDN